MNKKTIGKWLINRRKDKKQKGFTLVELIVVLVILAILAAILIPALLGYIDKAKEEPYVLAGNNIEKAARTMYTEVYAQKGYKIAMIKLNYTSNFQKTENGGHFSQLEAVYVYKDSTGTATKPLNKNDVMTNYKDMMKLVETNDLYLSGTSFIFFDQSGKIVSNTQEKKIGGQYADTELKFMNRQKKAIGSVKYDDGSGWYKVQE